MNFTGYRVSLFTLSGEFRNRSVEETYRLDKWPWTAKRNRVACLLTGLAYLSGVHGDYLTLDLNPGFFILLAIRLVAFSFSQVCLAVSRRKTMSRGFELLVFCYFLVIIGGETTELFVKPELRLHGMPFLSVVLLAYYMYFPGSPTLVVAAGTVSTVVYISGVMLAGFLPSGHVSTLFFTFLLINLFGAYYLAGMNRAQRREFLALEKEKELNQRLQQEIAERQKAERQLKLMATVDDLTGAYNRRHFSSAAERLILKTRKEGRPTSIVMIDADHFKAVNDRHGHGVGDQALTHLSDVCKSCLRAGDIFCRLGGEEFVALLPGAETEQAVQVAERIRQAVQSRPLMVDGKEISFTISLGVASAPPGSGLALDNLMRFSDQALYLAKAEGRNQVRVHLLSPEFATP